jgi:gluconokinase
LRERPAQPFTKETSFHPFENIEKMNHGVPLTNGDREKWLRTFRGIITRSLDESKFTVIACSILKAAYPDSLCGGDPRVKFVYLTGPRVLIEERLKADWQPSSPNGRPDFQLRRIPRRGRNGIDSGFGHWRLNLSRGFRNRKAAWRRPALLRRDRCKEWRCC